MARPLKLVAEDEEDLRIVAACLQDAVLPIGDMTYQPQAKRFVMIVNRFVWEQAEDGGTEGQTYERVHCAVRFEGVEAVRTRHIDRKRRSRIVELLTLESADGHIDLVFAGGAVIRLETAGIWCHLEDIDEPWPTKWKPDHAEKEA